MILKTEDFESVKNFENTLYQKALSCCNIGFSNMNEGREIIKYVFYKTLPYKYCFFDKNNVIIFLKKDCTKYVILKIKKFCLNVLIWDVDVDKNNNLLSKSQIRKILKNNH